MWIKVNWLPVQEIDPDEIKLVVLPMKPPPGPGEWPASAEVAYHGTLSDRSYPVPSVEVS